MIVDVIILLGITILETIIKIFSVINFIIPDEIPYYLIKFFSYVRLGDGIFPMSDIMAMLLTLTSVWSFLYILKIALFAFSAMPIIGKILHLPQHTTTTTIGIDTNQDPQGRVRQTSFRSVRRVGQKKRWM